METQHVKDVHELGASRTYNFWPLLDYTKQFGSPESNGVEVVDEEDENGVSIKGVMRTQALDHDIKLPAAVFQIHKGRNRQVERARLEAHSKDFVHGSQGLLFESNFRENDSGVGLSHIHPPRSSRSHLDSVRQSYNRF